MAETKSKKKYLEYLYEQYKKGVLDRDKIELLRREGYVKDGVIERDKKGLSYQRNITTGDDWLALMDPFHKPGKFTRIRDNITRDDWAVKNVLDHSPEFVHWINSMVYGQFHNKAEYKKFNYYKAQAWKWLQEEDSITAYHTDDGKKEFMKQEYNRCAENTLYFANKYGELKEGDISSGYIDYQAREHHAVIFFLFDSGYNVIGGKGRQIGFTSAMGIVAVKKLLFQSNYYLKFVTEDKDTGEEIFNDKIKYPFGALPKWMQPKVKSDSGVRFWLSDKSKKGQTGYPNSRVDVIAPKKTAINGGSPQLVLIDEIGNIGILGAMLNEGRPTMFWNNPKTGKFELKRQVWMWGCLTAGNKVYTKKGKVVNIEDLKQDDGIVGYNGNTAQRQIINHVNKPATKKCYRIETTGGNSIECSYDHPIMMSSREMRTSGNKYKVMFKDAKDIKKGDHLMMSGEVPIFGNKKVLYAKLLGLLIGDGNYTGRATNLYVNDDEIVEYVADNYNTTQKSRVRGDHRELYIKKFDRILKKHGMAGQSCKQKRLPDDVHTFDKESLAELLGGLFDSDGNVNYSAKRDTVRVVLTSAQKELLEQVKYQLLKFGIGCSITKEDRKSGYSGGYIYRLYISKHSDVLKFKENIPLLCRHKNEALDKACSLIKDHCWNEDGRKHIYIENPNCSEDGSYFEGKNMTGMRHERVVDVKYVGEKLVYNINASDTHTYLGNGFITHNTGGEMEKGKGVYEKEWYRILGLWEAGQYDNGFVPLFFSWHARFSAAEYEKEKAWYYGARAMEKEVDLETSKTQFHQHYPSSYKDMFLTTASTLVARDIVESGLERCRELSPELKPVHGYFEPIYDTNDPMPPESDVPYRIIDAEFIPINDDEDRHKATAVIFQKPEVGWLDRYWKGTDPIATESGHSKMASVVWDEYYKTVSCALNFRKRYRHKYAFLQSLLMGIYYDTKTIKTGIKELVEANIGTNYIDYVEQKGFFNMFIFNAELPSKVAGGAREVGVDTKGTRSDSIVEYMTEVIRTYHNRFYIYTIFDQLTTFVQTVTNAGKETWGPMNKLMHYDDVLYALAFAYIARLSYPHKNPKRREVKVSKYVTRYPLKRVDGYLIREPQRVPVTETSEVSNEIPDLL